jgi:hypothetical protein
MGTQKVDNNRLDFYDVKVTDDSGSWVQHVNVDSSALPAGGATEATLSSIDTTLDNAVDGVTTAIRTVAYEHHEIHSGSHYFVSSYADLAINHVLQFTWQMPDTTKWIHWTWSIDTEAETLWQIYEGGTITNPLANAFTPLNNNRNSSNTSGTTMRYEDHANLANANGDVDVSGALLLATGITGAGKTSSGNDERSNEIILKQNTLYVLRATATAAGYIDFNMQWYEHTNAA